VERGTLRERVHFAGRRSDVANIMRAATCLALPSRWEGMPNVVLEAMAAGLPVVATRVEGTSELITDGETGMLMSSHSSDELATRLAALLSDPVRRQAFASAAQSLVSERFAWDAVVAEYTRVYRRLLQK
jgi:glycosyltransferase involved in cell wall biosynthesis